jgi:hypothetical protein
MNDLLFKSAFFIGQLTSYIGFGLGLLDGYTYETEGYGLHPVLATLLCIASVYFGFCISNLKTRYALERSSSDFTSQPLF